MDACDGVAATTATAAAAAAVASDEDWIHRAPCRSKPPVY